MSIRPPAPKPLRSHAMRGSFGTSPPDAQTHVCLLPPPPSSPRPACPSSPLRSTPPMHIDRSRSAVGPHVPSGQFQSSHRTLGQRLTPTHVPPGEKTIAKAPPRSNGDTGSKPGASFPAHAEASLSRHPQIRQYAHPINGNPIFHLRSVRRCTPTPHARVGAGARRAEPEPDQADARGYFAPAERSLHVTASRPPSHRWGFRAFYPRKEEKISEPSRGLGEGEGH